MPTDLVENGLCVLWVEGAVVDTLICITWREGSGCQVINLRATKLMISNEGGEREISWELGQTKERTHITSMYMYTYKYLWDNW